MMERLKTLLESATGCPCWIGWPDHPGPGSVWLDPATTSDYLLSESGGRTDEVVGIKATIITGAFGVDDGELKALGLLDAQLEAFRALLESDVTLSGSVAQVRMVKAVRETRRNADGNGWEAGSAIELEVMKW